MMPGERGVILSILHKGDMRRRLIEIGFSPGSKIECMGYSPLGEPKAYRVKGAVFALRDSDARSIIVEHVTR